MEYINGLSYRDFLEIVDNMYDELLIYDNKYNIVYINKACRRHYGFSPDKMIGRSFYDFINAEWWGPSILPVVYKEKRAYAIRQATYLGTDLITIAVPLFDAEKNIKFVVMNVRDAINEIDLWNANATQTKYGKGIASVPIFASSEMQLVKQQIYRAAKLETTCLLCGEPGVGKTFLARYLHSISPRSNQSFAVFNCASMTGDSSANELFGSETYPGLLYRMKSGTLLLKNVSELPISVQWRLLKYLEAEHASAEWDNTSCLLLATTDKDLKALIKNGQFLEQLYYALNVYEIYIPPLRKRREDIRPLADAFCSAACAQYGLSKNLTEGAMKALENAEWQKNVSELRHTIERLVVTVDSPEIDTTFLPKNIFGIIDPEAGLVHARGENFDQRVFEYESYLIQDAYQKYGSTRKVAEHLGLSQTRASNLIRKYIKIEKLGSTDSD